MTERLNAAANPALAGPVIDVPTHVQLAPLKGSRNVLWQVLKAFRRQFLVAALFSGLANLLMLVPTLYMLQVFDRVMLSMSEITLVAVSLICLWLLVVMGACEWMRSVILVRAGVQFDEALGTRVFNASFEHGLGQTARRQPGRAFSDLLQVRQFITGPGVFALFDLPWVPIYIAVCYILHPILGLAAALFASLQLLVAWLSHRSAQHPSEAATLAQQEASAFLQSKLRNSEVVEAMGMSGPLRRKWLARHHQQLATHAVATHVTHHAQAWSKGMRYSVQSLTLGLGALLVIDGYITMGVMFAATALMSRALAPIDMVVGTWRSFLVARLGWRRLNELLAEHPQRDPALSRVAPNGVIELKGVCATAPGHPAPILKDITLSAQPNTITVVLGPSGSGKSTLARVLLGIWPVSAGDVLLDGRPIDSYDRDDLGPLVGYLPQDVELFDGTIAENIARFQDMDSDAVIEAARIAGLHDMILRFPKGYDTPMGEAGQMLSGGQRQRVALARALYGRPRLVVLDEPNANLDDVGEAALSQAVLALKQQGATVVIVSHRPGIVSVADHLVVLQGGQVQLAGPRDAVRAQFQQMQQAAQAQAQAQAQARAAAAAAATPTAAPTATPAATPDPTSNPTASDAPAP
jgi:ATP-binding cassette, subfamily C, bacterial exporter for protease/lipase